MIKKPKGKRRTREHIIADLSVNHVERQALLCGYTIERLVHDYGLDLELFTFNKKGEIEPGTVLLQLKASDRLGLRAEQTTFPFRVDRADLVHWLAQPMPVILIVYDAKKGVAYWLYVQSYFRNRKDFNLFTAGKTVTVQFSLKQVVNPQAMRKFARFRNRLLEQVSEVIHDDEEGDPLR
jgi:uncharacterized protein DUF4365